MSKASDKPPPIPLRDMFQKSMTASGGNSPTAFIAILDELDCRMQRTDDLVSKNNKVFEVLADWYSDADTTLKNLSAELDSNVSTGLRRVMPELTQQIEEKATTGARNGAMASQGAIQTLNEAIDDYEAKKREITTLATIGLPIVFGGAILIGVLFASFVIPALPATWEWPCKIIGADHRASTDQNSAITFCVIQRESK